MPTPRKYSSISQETSLAAALNSSATTMTVVDASILLAGINTIANGEYFTVVIDPDTALEEIVDVKYPSAAGNNTLTVERGRDGSQPIAHSPSAKVRHMGIGRDFTEANQHINNSTEAHGLTVANVVLKDATQTLTAKTLTSPTINGGTVSGAAVTGVATPTNAGDAAPKSYVDSKFDSSVSAATSAAAAAASALAAAGSATSAGNSATSATASASTATTKAGEASTSATNASASATTATTKAGEASTSASTATTKASEAVTSANNAATSANSAATSATNAANSATAASGSASTASGAVSQITGMTGSGLVRDMGDITEEDTTTSTYVSVSTLTTQATTAANNASTSATNASSSASSASTSASNASTSATNAANSATAAATSATNAANSATAAAASATTAASYIPSQTGNSGKFLTTNGTTASWADLSDWGTI